MARLNKPHRDVSWVDELSDEQVMSYAPSVLATLHHALDLYLEQNGPDWLVRSLVAQTLAPKPLHWWQARDAHEMRAMLDALRWDSPDGLIASEAFGRLASEMEDLRQEAEREDAELRARQREAWERRCEEIGIDPWKRE